MCSGGGEEKGTGEETFVGCELSDAGSGTHSGNRAGMVFHPDHIGSSCGARGRTFALADRVSQIPTLHNSSMVRRIPPRPVSASAAPGASDIGRRSRTCRANLTEHTDAGS